MPPEQGSAAAPWGVERVRTVIVAHHMCGYGFNAGSGAMLCASQIAVAHQRNVFAVDADDAVHHISARHYPCQHHVAHLSSVGLLQYHTLAPTYYKW